MKGFSKLCTPARIYFAIAVIAAIFSLFYGATLMTEALKLFFAFVWTFLLSWLCDKGFVSISWFLVLLPYILMLLSMMNIYHTTEQQRQLMRAVKMQGAFGKEPFVQEGFKIRSITKVLQDAQLEQQKLEEERTRLEGERTRLEGELAKVQEDILKTYKNN
jgi:cell division protein FtsL